MQETAQQYQQRLLSYVEKEDPIRVMQSTITRLKRYMSKATTSSYRKQASGKWNFSDLLAHLAEGEMVYGYRIRMIARANGCLIQAYDQNEWVRNSGYLQENPKMAFDLFRSLRLSNIAFLKRLNREHWEHYGIHSERGKESVLLLTRLMAGHDRNHLRQIQQLISPK